MILRSIFAHKTKIHRPSLHSSILYRILNEEPIFEASFHSGFSQKPEILDLRNHKDWLSPTEVIKIFRTLKDPNSTLTVLSQLSKRKDYRPNETLYTTVINNLAQANNFDGIEQVMSRIKLERRCRLSDAFFYNVIKIYGHSAGRINRAIETLFDMPNYSCWPTVKTFNFVLNLLVSTNNFDVVHEVYLGASRLGVEIDACCLNIIVKGLCKNGDVDVALQMLDEFPKQGCEPNVRTFSTLMHGLCERGRVEEAFALFENMEREGIEPDTITMNILISGSRRNGGVDRSIELFDRMMLKGCEPNAGTYQEILYCLLDSKRFVEAKDLMRKMESKRINPSFKSYKLAIQGLCNQNLIGDVDLVLNQMVQNGFVPKMAMWTQILRRMFLENRSVSYKGILED